ncbi:hypothetical protein [Commensalibacter nepenthis]|uniref:Uncharacterized protein n=1 Tax=Commensalibacter nepenthis TaxID=3043872 RepID=A0ABT6Q742_9PROT|nr:hypothetical protein [Commensalibacter sp. TBRC 10068]MDI2112699.1 hypothetical protein [Commensalibacter sp. TBRC 10068]
MMIEIKGKDDGVLQLEVNYTSGGGIEYTFYYKNNDVFFMCKDDYCDDGLFSEFKWDLQELLKKKPISSVKEKLYQEPDSWLTIQLKKIFPSWSAKTSKPLIKDMEYNSCSFCFIYPDASLECKQIKDSLDYIIEFKFVDPNIVQDIDEDMLILKGSFVVTRPALWDFHQDLLSL